ncbi:MAG TPA: TniQ family protein [Ktedonobacteraceae bacterium]|nr:TniQ family protein [Ktedonobacteraceae bacterium]
MSIPALPPRSRCYQLEPIGVGTAWVESLTGYVARLAATHQVTLKALINLEILPWQEKVEPTSLSYARVKAFWNTRALRLNGTTTVACEWVETMQALTECDNLRFLTMLSWSEVAGERVPRQRKAWCPRCYQIWHQEAEQAIYKPLLWTLNGVDLCLRHQQPLVTVCPHCHISPAVLSPHARPGYCSHCTRWLGVTGTEGNDTAYSSNANQWQQQYWKTKAVGELLAGASAIPSPPSKSQVAKMLGCCIDKYTPGNPNLLARILGFHPQYMWSYLNKGRVPSFDMFLQICFELAIPPLEFFTASTLPSINPSWFVIEHLPVVSRGKKKRITAEDKEKLRQALELVLAEDIRPRPLLQDVAQRLGYDVTTLYRHFPKQSKAIAARYRGRSTRNVDPSLIQQTLEAALKAKKPVPLVNLAKQIGCSTATLRRHCPALCQAVVERYRSQFDYDWIEQQLQYVIASKEPIPSLAALARQLKCTPEILSYQFPDLCVQITARRQIELREHHEARINRIQAEVRQAVMVIHQQGRYPSARQVAKLLSIPQDIRSNEARETWHIMVAALGYDGRGTLKQEADGITSSRHA